MPQADLESDFPDLAASGYSIESDIDPDYNCIAFACGIMDEWMDPCEDLGYSWPDGIARDGTIASLIEVFQRIGYVVCDDGVSEKGFEKVAIYGSKLIYEHAALQISNEKWVSKIGPDEDIQHRDPSGLCGDLYGEVIRFMKRPTRSNP